eukprot:Seg9401.2 transcript_id=Seg9401.2/GoldUCD/mRNA.D3Y31 product="Thymic stromal cotransporter protein" protein_id=Seg9401.2/GoldUCD/D3Y31
MIGFYLSNVSSPQLILENICRKYHNDTICQAMFAGFFHGDGEYKKIQEEAAMWIGGCKFVGNLVKLFALPTAAVLSDVFGRHRAMFLIPLTMAVRSSIMLYIVNTGMPFSTWWLLLVGPITGLVGGVGGLFMFTIAYVSDITPNEERTLRITLIDASAVFAAFTAMLTSGFIIEKFGYFWIFVAILCLATLAFLDWLFLIKPDTVNMQSISKESVVFSILSMDALIKPGLVSSHVYSDNKIRDLRKPKKRSKFSKQAFAGCKRLRKSMDEKLDSVEQVQETEETGEARLQNDSQNKAGAGDHSHLKVHELHNANAALNQERSSGEDLGPENFRKQIENHYADDKNTLPYLEVVNTHTDNGSGTAAGHTTTIPGTVSHPNANAANTNSEGFLNRKLVSSNENEMDLRLAWRKIRHAANPFRNFARMFKAVKETANIKLEMVLLFVMGLTQISNIGELNLIVIFLRNHPFHLSPKSVGFLLAFQRGLVSIIGLIFSNIILQRFFRINDLVTILVSSACSIVYFLLMALAKSTTMLYINQVLHAFCTLNIPAIRAFLSKMSKPSSVGTIMGLVTMVETLSSAIACFAAPVAYSKLAEISPGAVFFVFALLMLITTIITATLNYQYPKDH